MTVPTRESATDDRSRTERVGADQHSRPNVGRWERVASTVVGCVLLLRGLRRRSLGGVATAVAGGALVARGVSGNSRLYRMLDTEAEGETITEREQTESTAGEPSIERSITVGKPAEELSEYWREPDQLTRIVGEFADVSATATGEDRHRWLVHAPLGRHVDWETRLVEERPGELLRWESSDGALIPHEATVQFQPAPGDRGTEVTLEIQYDPPGGPLGNAAMQRLGVVPEALAGTALDRFKSLAETGEVPSLEKNPSARGAGDLL